MWLLAPLLLAALSSTTPSGKAELQSRLGLGPRFWVGSPFLGGRTVLVFDDGSRIVELVTQDDFAAAGTSLGNFQLAGLEDPSTGERSANNSVLLSARQSGRSLVFVYVDPQNIPEAHLVVERPNLKYPELQDLLVVILHAPLVMYRASPGKPAPSFGKVPEHLQDKVLAFWLDLMPHLPHTDSELAAAVFDEKHFGNAYAEIKTRWYRDSLGNCSQEEYERVYPAWKALDDRQGHLSDDEEEEIHPLHMQLVDMLKRASEDSDRLIRKIESLGVLRFSKQDHRFEDLATHLPLRQRPGIHIWSWDVTVPGSAGSFIGTPDFKLELHMFQPNTAWMKEHQIDSPQSGPRFDAPLLSWRLLDLLGNEISRQPYDQGLFEILETNIAMRDKVVEQVQSLSEDAAVVGDRTQRRWIVPIEEVLAPLKVPRTLV